MKKCVCQSLPHLFFGNIFLVNRCLFGIDSSDNSSPDEQSEDDANVNEFPKGMKSELLEPSPLSAEYRSHQYSPHSLKYFLMYSRSINTSTLY